MASTEDSFQGADNLDDSLASRRSRRSQSKGKSGRLAALDQLKRIKKGEKIKYEVEEVKNVYDIVDDEEYSDVVRKRQDEDWIIDDNGAGYVEDGREIFDDDLLGDDEDGTVAEQKNKKKKFTSKPNTKKVISVKPANNIMSMFAAAGVKSKKSDKDAKIGTDDLLDEIMNDLGRSPADIAVKPLSMKRKARPSNHGNTTPRNTTPRNPFNKTPKKPNTPLMRPRQMAQEIAPPRTTINRIKENTSQKPAKKPRLTEPIIQVKEEVEDIEDEIVTDNDNYGNEVSDADMALLDDDDDDFADVLEEEIKIKEEKEVKVEPVIKKEEKKPEYDVEALASTGWETIKGQVNNGAQKCLADEVHIDSSSLPLTKNEEGEQVLRFYWFDSYEDPYKQPGVVYLFGKVWIESAKTHISCCVPVKNIERQVFLLPRETNQQTNEPVGFRDIYEEFNSKIAEKYKLMKFKCRKVTKKYCFELHDVPAESEYLEVRYAADLPQLPSDLTGDTFSAVFGTNTSCCETLLMERKIHGPCWLDIKMPQLSPKPVSWCKVEAFVTRPDHVTVIKDLTPPPLVVMTISLRTVLNTKTHQNEVIAIAGLVHHEYHIHKSAPNPPFQQHFCAIGKPSDCIFPFDFQDVVKRSDSKCELMATERALLGYFLAMIHRMDPDIIVGHDIFSFDLDVLLHRINTCKVPHWSRIGRLRRQVMPKLSGPGGRSGNFAEKNATCGRMISDVKISAKELIRCKSYELTELASFVLKESRIEIPFEEIKNMYISSKQLMYLVEQTWVDASLILRIMCELNVLPLALQITTICGNVMSKTLMGGRSERNEYLLLHAFHDKGFIYPDKQFKKKAQPVQDNDEEISQPKKGRKKPAYAGGLVLEPKKGFYDKFILLLDFNSLYPSIIQEYNICFTTIDRTPPASQAEDEDWLPEVPDPNLEAGILPTEIRKLVERRRQVKSLMKDKNISNDLRMQYDIRQKALKLTANSMYGCLGFSHSRFYAKPLAAMVTGKGREILMKTKELVEKMNLDVIYGDTDSIMINTNTIDFEEVYKMGNKVKSEVNKLYKLLEIDIDGVFKSMLLLKKKKYAALAVQKSADGTYTTTQELKGLDIVRRDWSGLAKEVGNYVIGQILSAESRETIVENIHTHLIDVGEKVKNNKLPMHMYEIHKSLTKSPQDYPDKKSLPHVHVALWMNTQGGKEVGAGDTVAYVICEDGSNLPASQRAYHPDEAKKRNHLKIDTKYYLSQQVHPVVSRLCDPIDGTDAAHIAECLGLDPSSYKQALRQQEADHDAYQNFEAQITDEERYKDCEPFKFVCPACKRENIIDVVITSMTNHIVYRLEECSNEECMTPLFKYEAQIKNQLRMMVRRCVTKYYDGWLVCEDTSCNHRTRCVPINPQRHGLPCPVCQRALLKPEYTSKALYTQLRYFKFIFDAHRAIQSNKDKSLTKPIFERNLEARSTYDRLLQMTESTIQQSGYSEVNLSRLFESLFTIKV
ncbi:DNA polymerase alpha catalytic subunit-like [Anneissia japonica]|uniref:DNA polymerase alpha catalytic subunit-like n=1 Tax=Anneissia japonica TaxID=1529436 RepID=UPI00142562F2|nr:DNA polymerase alpha catalytic subunit-like [Anneissia japonica]